MSFKFGSDIFILLKCQGHPSHFIALPPICNQRCLNKPIKMCPFLSFVCQTIFNILVEPVEPEPIPIHYIMQIKKIGRKLFRKLHENDIY